MKVLVADDDLATRRLLLAYLQRWGHEVALAEDGDQAWSLFRAGDFSVVVSDWMMPGMDGIALAERIRSAGRPSYVYILLLTARAHKEDVVAAMEAGADDFLSKPFDRDELRVRLRAAERLVHLEQTLSDRIRQLQETHDTFTAITAPLAAAAAELALARDALRSRAPDPDLERHVSHALASVERVHADVKRLA